MSVHMITGHLGYAHVQPQDEANMNNRMIGEGRFTFNSSMSYKKTNNVLSITAKGLMIDGRRFDIDAENVTITTGTAGLYRKDRVVLTYTMNMEYADKMGVESAYLEVIRGTPANSKASAVLPAYVDAAIDSVNTFAQIPLYNVEINETTIENITSLIGSKNITMEQARGHIADKNIHITSTERTNWNDANSKKHTHSNKSIIDKITQTLLDNWSAAYTHISDAVKHITADERTKWNQAASPVDNLNETTTGKSLDAHQGYVLNEAISTNSYGEYAGGKNLFDIEDLSTSSSAWGIVHKSVYIPKGTYTLSLKSTTSSEFQFYDASNNLIKKFGIGSSGTNRIYNTLELTEDCYYLNVWINNGTLSDIQIELGTTATDYEPYIKSNYQLVNDKADKSEVCVNLLKPTLETTTINGITCTNNGDGTYTLNGTATAGTNFNFITSTESIPIAGKKLKMLGTKGASSDKFCLIAGYYDSSFSWKGEKKVYDEGFVIDENSVSYPYVRVDIYIASGATLDNIVIKPMVTTDLTATYDDFVPYTGDKGRINEEVAELNKKVTGMFSLDGTTLTITTE